MAIVSDVEIRLRADIARLQQDLNRARSEVNGALSQMTRAVQNFRNVLAGIGIGVGLGNLIGQMITAQREFDKLNSSLITVTGSSQGAAQAFDAIQKFAARTPYSLQEVTEGFLKLRNLGLTPSERALTSYGNTASAMGKDLNQLIEAVADAATGEFERLKEFGVKSKQQGDQVAFTFQGTTTTVKNSSEEIEKYLMRIGEVNFAGAMELQADTLNGALSALGDSWNQTLIAFSTSGFGVAVKESAIALSNALTDLQAIIRSTTTDYDKQKKTLQEITPLHSALTEVFTVASVAIRATSGGIRQFTGNLQAYWDVLSAAIKGRHGEIAGIIAERARQSKLEAQATDKDIEKIRWAASEARKVRAEEAKQGGDRLAGLKIESKAVQGLTDAQQKAAETAKKTEADRLKNYQALIQAAQQAAFETGREAAGLERLTKSQEMAKALDEGLISGKIKLTATEEAYYRALIETIGANEDTIKANEKAAASAENVRAAVEALDESRRQTIDSARTEAESAERLVETFGMTASAIEQMTVARLEDRLARRVDLELDEKEINYLTELIALKQRSANSTGQLEELQKTRDLWDSIDKTAHDTFVSILDGGKDAATRLKDTFKNIFFEWLYQQTLKKWIIQLEGNVSLGGLLGGASGGGGGNGGLMQMGKTIYEGFQKAFGSGSSGAASALGIAAGVAGGVFGGRAISGGYSANGGSGNGTVNAGTAIGAAIGSVVPVLGTALGALVGGLLGGATNRLFGRKAPEVLNRGIEGTAFAGGITGQNFAEILEKGGVFRSDKRYFNTSALDAETEKYFDDSMLAVVAAVRGAGDALGVQADFIEGYNKQFKLTFGADEAANQKLIQDTFAGIADELSTRLVPNLSQFAAAGETASATLARLVTEFQAVQVVFDAMGVDSAKAFGAVGVASLEARTRLVALAGGIEALGQQSDFFAQNFLTDAERLAPVQKAVTEQLAALGYAGVDTADEFKGAIMALANAGALATESGAKTYAALLALAPAFKQVADASEAAARAEKDLAAEREAAAVQALRDTATTALGVLQRSIDGQKEILAAKFDDLMERLGKSITAQQGKIDRLGALQGALAGARTGDLSDMQLQVQRQQGQAQILAALAIAKASGVLPTADSLQSALAAVSRDAGDQFATFVEYQRDQLLTQNSIEELSGLTTDQLGTAERTLAVLERQRDDAQRAYDSEIVRLDGILASAQLQLDAINGVNLTATSVLSAFSSFQAAVTAALGNKTIASGPSSAEAQIENLYQQVFGRKSDIGGLSYYSNLLRGGTGLSDIEAGLRSSEEYKAMQRSGMYSVQQNGTMAAGTGAVVAQLETLNGRMANIEAATSKTATSTGQQAAQFDRVTYGGNVLRTETA